MFALFADELFQFNLLKFMRYENAPRSVLLIGFFIFIFGINAIAQSTSPTPDSPRIVNFGWSLKQFEIIDNKNKKGKKDKKEKDSSQMKDVHNNVSGSQPAAKQNLNSTNKPDSANKQNSAAANGEETIRVETNLVINDVLVVNDKAQAVTNLQAKDFIIIEDGTEQKPGLFSFGDSVRRSIVLILNNKRLYAKEHKDSVMAAQRLIDKLTPRDKMAIVSTEMKLILDFTSDKELLKKTVSDITPLRKRIGGEARDYGTLMAVLAEMFDEKDVRSIVIFQTNGEEAYGLKKDKDALSYTDGIKHIFAEYDGERGYGFSDVIDRIKKSKATIYSICTYFRFIGLPKEEQLKIVRKINRDFNESRGIKESPFIDRIAQRKSEIDQVNDLITDQMAMMQVAKLSGGYAEFLAKPEDAEKVYNTIFAVINNRYTIGYYSTNDTKDKKERTVKIQVRGHPEYTILSRESYLPST